SQHLTRLTVRSDVDICAGYLTCFLNSNEGKVQLVYGGYGSTRQELTHAILRQIKLPLPDIDLQRRIDSLVRAGLQEIYEGVEHFKIAVAGMEALLGFNPAAFPGELRFGVAGDEV